MVAEGVVVEDCDVEDGIVVGWAVEDWVVVEVLVVVLWGCEDVEVLVASGVHSSITQYDLPASRLGQVIPCVDVYEEVNRDTPAGHKALAGITTRRRHLEVALDTAA